MAVEPSLDALLARPDVDAVLLGTPTPLHHDQAIAAAVAGKHVFTEKPIAATLPEIDAMIAACRRAGVLLAVNAVTRWRRGVRLAKGLVDAGEIGQIRMVRHTYAHVAGGYAPVGHWILSPAAGSPFLDQGRTATMRSAGSSGPMRRPRSPPTPRSPAPRHSARARWSRSISPTA